MTERAKTLRELKEEFEKSKKVKYIKTNAGKHIGYGSENSEPS